MSDQEKDNLKYIGNKVPKVITFVWIVFFVFMFVYLVSFMMPDLKEWMAK